MKEIKNKQDAFDVVWNHFVVNKGKKSYAVYQRRRYGPGRCLYHGSGGSRCAIGVILPDDLYSESLEEVGPIDAVLESSSGIKAWAKEIGMSQLFALELQQTHDSAAATSDMKFFHAEIQDNLTEFAKRFRLKIPNVGKVTAKKRK